jgi:hypothetical protein
VPRGQRDGSLLPYSLISRQDTLLFLSSSSSIVFMRLSGPRSRPLLLRKSCSAGNRTSGSVARNCDADNFIVAFRLLSLGSDGRILECETCF